MARRAQRRGGQWANLHQSAEQQALSTYVLFGTLLGLLLGVILAVPLSPNARISVGEPSPVSLQAPRSITFRSDVQTRELEEHVANDSSLVVTQRDAELPARQRSAMQQAFNRIDEIRRNQALSAKEQEAALTTISSVPISPTLASHIVALDDNTWRLITQESQRIYNSIWQDHENELSQEDIATIRAERLPSTSVDSRLTAEEREIVLHFVSAFLASNLIVDEAATEERREAALAEIDPVMVTIQEGESIVRAGDFVTEVTYEKLQKLGLVFGAGGIIAILQQILLGMLVAWLLSSYLLFYQTDLAKNWRALAIIGGMMLAIVLAGRMLIPTWDRSPYVFPLAVAGIVLTLLFDKQLGLIIVLILAPLLGMQADNSIGLTFTLALGGAAAVFATHRAARSVTFIWVSIAVSLVTTLAAAVFWFDRIGSPSWTQVLPIPLFSLLNGGLSSALAIGTYQLLGRVAHISTPLQLMELAHPTQPLLHKLMREAPGTYHHSIVVANLAEVAAEDIGADPLLARVGAYYHDIGKVTRPYFFTDNQYERSNVHDELDAKTSATLIIDHVRDGEKLARQHGLPQPIIDFILQHHGTMVVSYFYQRALHEDGDVDIKDFRYPGPKPQIRETGIMMLADGVEAAVRANSQSGKLRPARFEAPGGRDRNGLTIKDVVEQIVNDRVRTGQLDECPLTMRDISIIKASFTKTLQGIYHPRVDYPPSQPTTEPLSESV